MLLFQVKSFDELTKTELYDLLQLRAEVFVVEQDCVYQDIDGKDQLALHVLGYKDGTLVAYTRLFAPGAYFKKASIGRVIVKQPERINGYGKSLMQTSIQAVYNYYKSKEIEISAQTYLLGFYADLGFKQIGEGYLEDEIPHIKMIK